MISDKAVEAAAKAWSPHLFPESGCDLSAAQQQGALLMWMRAALQAALPALLEGREEEIRNIVVDAIRLYPNKHTTSYVQATEAASRIISILTGESDER